MGLFGGSAKEFQELCIYFKVSLLLFDFPNAFLIQDQIFGFIVEIYNPSKVRFTTVEELADDIKKLLTERMELLQVKLSNELLPV
jgi:hypothetical protein